MNTSRVWILGGVVLAIAVLAGGYFVGVAPALASAEAADRNVEQVDAQNLAQRAELDRLKVLAETSDQIAEQLAELQKSIPTAHGMRQYDRRIEQLAIAAGAGVREIFFNVDELLVGAAIDTGNVQTPDANPGALVAVPISLKVVGTRAQVLAFLRALQYDERFITVNSLTIDSPGDDTATESELQVKGFLFVLPEALGEPETDGVDPGVDPASGSANG